MHREDRQKTYCILGGGGAFGIFTAMHFMAADSNARVVSIGRSPLQVGAFSLGVEHLLSRRFSYRTLHVGYDFDFLLECLDDLQPDVIVNFAAQGEGAVSWKHSWRFFDTNATALVRLYEALCDRDWAHRGRFIQIGTSELYGTVEMPVDEDAPIQPSSPYAVSKAAFDLYLLAMMKRGSHHIPTTILRPSNAYCSGQRLHRIIPRAIVAGLTNRKVPLHGGGVARKSYIHAADLARAIKLVADADFGVLRRPVYNVGPVQPTAIRDVARMCAAAVDKEFDAIFEVAAERPGQDACYWLNSTAIFTDVGWEPEIGWKQGLAEVVRWAKTHLSELASASVDYQMRG